MSAFDIAAGATAATADSILATVYGKIYPQVFTGSTETQIAGLATTVAWNVTQVPTVTLTGAGSSTFQLLLPSVTLTVTPSGQQASTDTLAITITCTAVVTGQTLALVPQSAVATGGGDSDDAIINSIVLPQAMTMAKTLLSGITLPPLSFAGLNTSPPYPLVEDNLLLAFAGVGSTPQPPASYTWPSAPFFLMIDQSALTTAANAELSGFSETFSPSGSKGPLSYSANVTISNVSVSPGGDPLNYAFIAKVSGTASGSALLMTIDYTVSATVTGTITVAIANGTQLQATTQFIAPFSVSLSPTGSFGTEVLSIITEPLVLLLTDILQPDIDQALEGITIPITTIPQVPVTVDGVTVTVDPVSLSLAAAPPYLVASGSISFS